jgi:enoyl-CoA hydratase/carnithine racemase
VTGQDKTPTQLDIEVVDSIAYLTLNGPPKNELGVSFFQRLSELSRTTLSKVEAKGMIVQGKGRHFSSGADVPEIESLGASSSHRVAALLEDNIESFLVLSRMPCPVLAVIRGACLGAGMELALACHFRVAEKSAIFSLPEVTYDLMPGCGGTVRLPRLVGTGKAIELILSGRTVSADEARDIGLVDQVVDRRRGVEAALEIIRTHTSEAAP